MTPWKLSVEFDKEKHLFSDLVTTNYFVMVYNCSCGHNEFIISSSNEEDYTCSICNNEVFYDANYAKKQLEYFLDSNKNLKLEYKYELTTYKDKIRASYVTYVPSSINFMQKQINYTPVIKHFLEINYDGIIKKSCEDSFIDMNIKMRKLIEEYLNKNIEKLQLPNPGTKIMTLDKASFFFDNKSLKDFEFFYWEIDPLVYEDDELTLDKAFTIILNGRKEKSVKKAMFKNYASQIKNNNKYISNLPKIFIEKVDDPNLLIKFLNLDIYSMPLNFMFVGRAFSILSEVYSSKQLYRLFCEVVNEDKRTSFLFNDLVHELITIGDLKAVYAEYKKLRCTLMVLHDGIIDYNIERRKKEILGKDIATNKINLKPCVHIDDYEVKLPKKGDELYQWANDLSNCMASYFNTIQNNQTLIYCFFINEKIDFAIEIRNNLVIQASGLHNATLDASQKEVLGKWIKRFFNPEITKIPEEHGIPIEIIYD